MGLQYDYSPVVYALSQRFGQSIRLYKPVTTINLESGAVTRSYRIDFLRHIPVIPKGKTWGQGLQMGVQYVQADYQALIPGSYPVSLESHIEYEGVRYEVLEIVILGGYGYLLNLKSTKNPLIGIVVSASDGLSMGGDSDGQL